MPLIDLPDPRLARPRQMHPLLIKLLGGHFDGLMTPSSPATKALTEHIESLLAARRDEELRDLLARPASPTVSQWLWRCVQRILDDPREQALRAEYFAIPLILVAGARRPAVLDMLCGDVSRLRSVFETVGCLGPARQFALSPALCDRHALEAASLSDLYHRTRFEVPGSHPLEFPPAPLNVGTPESVSLRFLVGAALTSSNAPCFAETAGEVGRWGMALSREITTQLSLEGVTLLALPRAPLGLLQALGIGKFCREEIAFQLFAGEALRALNARVGEPRAVVWAWNDDRVSIQLQSPWEDREPFVHDWYLHPVDDFEAVKESISGFLQQCRVDSIEVHRQLHCSPLPVPGKKPEQSVD